MRQLPGQNKRRRIDKAHAVDASLCHTDDDAISIEFKDRASGHVLLIVNVPVGVWHMGGTPVNTCTVYDLDKTGIVRLLATAEAVVHGDARSIVCRTVVKIRNDKIDEAPSDSFEGTFFGLLQLLRMLYTNDTGRIQKVAMHMFYLMINEHVHNDAMHSILHPHVSADTFSETRLLPFQVRVVSWMLYREGYDLPSDFVTTPCVLWQRTVFRNTPVWINLFSGAVSLTEPRRPTVDDSSRGGILADEMGLGKTLDVLACIKLHRANQAFLRQKFTDVTPSKATLIIAPLSIVGQWQFEIKKHVPELRVFVYEPNRKTREAFQARVLTEYDVVITSIEDLRQELGYTIPESSRSRRFERKYQIPPSPLIKIFWWRVCVDEAQMVEGNSKSFQMATKIPRRVSWAVSGTPVTKKIGDFQHHLEFLQVPAICQSFVYLAKRGSQRWYALLAPSVAPIFYRNTKAEVESRGELSIPKQHVLQVWVNFSAIEQTYYRQQLSNCLAEVNISNLAGMEETLEKARLWFLRLRQTCCHPQIALNNVRELGQKLRTVDQVLLYMRHTSIVETSRAKKAILQAWLREAQTLDSATEYRRAFDIVATIIRDSRIELLNFRRRAAEAKAERRKQLGIEKRREAAAAGHDTDVSDNDWNSDDNEEKMNDEEEDLAVSSSTDMLKASSDLSDFISVLQKQKSIWLEFLHQCAFFAADICVAWGRATSPQGSVTKDEESATRKEESVKPEVEEKEKVDALEAKQLCRALVEQDDAASIDAMRKLVAENEFETGEKCLYSVAADFS